MNVKALMIIISGIVILASCSKNHKQVIVDQPDGYWREVFYINKDGVKNGKYLKYFANGNLWDSCNYKMGKLHGERKIYSSDGFLEIREQYVNGIIHGPYRVYYPDGTLKLEQSYNNGVLEGISLAYYPSGVLKEKVTMSNNMENGYFEEYYENSVIRYKGQYLNGNNEHDTLYHFNNKGILISKMFCQHGICNTVWILEAEQEEF